jgi:ABC-type Fe3+ transport system substrate-binding protein
MTYVDNHAHSLGQLDVLGRVPVPLRRAFAAGLDRTAGQHRARTGATLRRLLLTGAEWYRPFDTLVQAKTASEVPSMLITPLQHDVLDRHLLRYYAAEPLPAGVHVPEPIRAARVLDATGLFRVFSIVPFVWLVDEHRLKGRPVPRSWSDLLQPCWAGEIVFGGFRPNDAAPYREYNGFLLDCIQHEFGDDGLLAFARNVLHLQHNVRTARLSGSNHASVGAIAVLPWLQAELCPRRERVRVVWPVDGALVMPIAYLLQAEAKRHLSPVVDYLQGPDLAAVLGRNCYPAAGAGLGMAKLPAAARFKWPGWEFFRHPELELRSSRTADLFFQAYQTHAEARSCG